MQKTCHSVPWVTDSLCCWWAVLEGKLFYANSIVITSWQAAHSCAQFCLNWQNPIDRHIFMHFIFFILTNNADNYHQVKLKIELCPRKQCQSCLSNVSAEAAASRKPAGRPTRFSASCLLRNEVSSSLRRFTNKAPKPLSHRDHLLQKKWMLAGWYRRNLSFQDSAV